MAQKYHKLELLGEGTYGKVYKARCTVTSQLVAIKRLFNTSDEGEGLSATTLREIAILKEIKHENIIALRDVLFHPPKLTLVFELCDCDLKKQMRSQLGSETIRSYAYQMLKGIECMHKQQIVHRDLKPQNILVCDEGKTIKICDFGLARVEGIPIKKYSHEAVTLWYRPPDVILGSSNYGLGVDIWSAGCIIAEMLGGEAIFNGKNECEQLHKMFTLLGRPTAEDYPNMAKFPEMKKFQNEAQCMMDESIGRVPKLEEWVTTHRVRERGGEEAVELLRGMLQYNPRTRWTATKCLEHAYFAPFHGRKAPAEIPVSETISRQVATALPLAIPGSPTTSRPNSPSTSIANGEADAIDVSSASRSTENHHRSRTSTMPPGTLPPIGKPRPAVNTSSSEDRRSSSGTSSNEVISGRRNSDVLQ